MSWIPVTEEEAWQHPLYGFGGWLFVIYGIEVLLLGNTLYTILDIANRAGIDTVLSPSFATIWAHVALHIPFLVMAPIRARAMPLVAIICFWAGFAWSFGYALLYSFAPVMTVSTIVPMLLSPIWGVVFTVYLLRSRRVNVTYRLRVRPGEQLAAGPAAEGAA